MSRQQLLRATCAALLPSGDTGKAPDWVQLLPLGKVEANDGRAWTNSDPANVIAASKLPIIIDYDHGSHRAPKDGQNTRASGSIEELSAHGPKGEPGIWGRVEWTPSGGAAVAAKEYRYISPEFAHTKDTNVIKRIDGAGLTNRPALELVALASSQPETEMDLTKLRAALGLPDTASMDDVLNAISGLRTSGTALCSIAKAAGLAGDKVGDTEVTAICAKLKTPAQSGDATALAAAQTQIDNLQKQVATLNGRLNGNDATREVDIAIASGKIVPAQRDWAIDYCTRDPEGFKKFVGNQPVILASGRVAPSNSGDGETLSADELAICSMAGVTPENFKKTRAAEKAALAVRGAN